MLIHPQFDPVAIHLGPIGVHWYGLMYLAAFVLFLILGRVRARQGGALTVAELDDMLFYGVLGVIIGGRLGYIVFYKLSFYLQHPLDMFKVWEGGMSFHGGLIGVLVAMALFARNTKKHFFTVADFVAPLVPLGLLTGRFGNFINGELWGRVTAPDAPWAMIFPQARTEDLKYIADHPEWRNVFDQFSGLPRHPSQLYQMALEGLALFLILWLFTRRPRPMGAASALFLIFYGTFRFIGEFARQPDDFLGLLSFGLSMGQWLSLPMVIIGFFMLHWAYRKRVAQA